MGAGEGGRDPAEQASERLSVKREIIEQMQRGVKMRWVGETGGGEEVPGRLYDVLLSIFRVLGLER